MCRLSVLVAVALLTPTVAAQEHDHPVLPVQKLGTVRFATSCSAAAQPSFIRGVALLHSFAFSEAIDAVNDAVKTDLGCALNRNTGDWHRGALADRSMVARPIAQSSRSCCAESDDSKYSSG